MRKFFIMFAVMILAVVSGCTDMVSQEEYNAVVSENNGLQDRVTELQGQVDELQAQVEEYENSQDDELTNVMRKEVVIDKSNSISIEINEVAETGLVGVAACKFDGTDYSREWFIIASLIYEFQNNDIGNIAITIDSNGEVGLVGYTDGEYSTSVLPSGYDPGIDESDIDKYQNITELIKAAFSDI